MNDAVGRKEQAGSRLGRLRRDVLAAPINVVVSVPQGLASFWSATISPGFETSLSDMAGVWGPEDIALVPGRPDAMHHIYFAERDAALLGKAEAP